MMWDEARDSAPAAMRLASCGLRVLHGQWGGDIGARERFKLRDASADLVESVGPVDAPAVDEVQIHLDAMRRSGDRIVLALPGATRALAGASERDAN
jgi:hypothetical protein